MGFKSVAVGAAASLSVVSAVLPAFAQHVPAHHPLITPVQCFEGCGSPSSAGSFAYFGTLSNGHFLSFGETDTVECEPSFVGARIDAQGFPANNWSVLVHTANGNSNPEFFTELRTSHGTVITIPSRVQKNANSVLATFNGAELGYPGATIVSIWVYDSSYDSRLAFRDTIELVPGSGTQVDGVYPISTDYHSIVQPDCTPFNFNITL